ncbi:MAG: DUF2721 domain-containing protein [Phycisphaeraceae bacterium]
MIDTSVMSAMLTPAIMISACGLLCLAQFARYTTLIGRARGFNHERYNLMRQLRQLDEHHAETAMIKGRVEALSYQAQRVIVHARLIRDALVLLISCIMLMIITSLLLAGSLLLPACSPAAFISFIMGMLCILAGMSMVLWEMLISLSLIRYETSHVETFGAIDQLRSGSPM